MKLTRRIMEWCDENDTIGAFVEGMIDGCVLASVYFILAGICEDIKSNKK